MSPRQLFAVLSMAVGLSGCAGQRVQSPVILEPPAPQEKALPAPSPETLPSEKFDFDEYVESLGPSHPLILKKDADVQRTLRDIRSASEKELVVVIVGAGWCHPCHALEYELKPIASELGIKVFVFDMAPDRPNSQAKYNRAVNILRNLTGDDWKKCYDERDKAADALVKQGADFTEENWKKYYDEHPSPQCEARGFRAEIFPTVYYLKEGVVARRYSLNNTFSKMKEDNRRDREESEKWIKGEVERTPLPVITKDEYKASTSANIREVLEFFLKTSPRFWPEAFEMPKWLKVIRAKRQPNVSKTGRPAP